MTRYAHPAIQAHRIASGDRNGLPEGGGYVYRGTKKDRTDAPPMAIISRPCPVCQAPPGTRCRRADGATINTYHRSRRIAP